MCGMPCVVQRMVACRPPGVPTVPARATSGDAGVLPASARAASAASSAIPRTTMRALTLLPIEFPLLLRRGRLDAELLPAGEKF